MSRLTLGMPRHCVSKAIATTISVLLVTQCGAVPSTSLAIKKTGLKGCGPPDFGCLGLVNVTTPKPKPFEVLIRVSGSSMNPDEVSILKIPFVHYTPGIDVSGTVAAVGLGVSSLKVGDRVWTTFVSGGMAEYTTRIAALTAIVPDGVDLERAGTLPTVAMTALGALQSAGAPWSTSSNTSVLITAGTGGTGYVAVQLAKALGAAHVVTAAAPENLEFVRSLGADEVVDYHKHSVFDVVADGSVDVVLDNHVADGTAERAMQKLRAPGGSFVTIDGELAKNPPAGIKQVKYLLLPPFVDKLDTIGRFLSDGKMRIEVQDTFDFKHVRDAFRTMAAGHVRSKLSMVPQKKSQLQKLDMFTV